MRMTTLLLLILALGLLAATLQAEPTSAACLIAPTRLKTEYTENPIAVAEARPRFYWQVTSKERNQMQHGYQILVADTPEILARDTGNLWDTNRVEGSQTTHVVYSGKRLASRQRAWWKVRVWDGAGKMSAWSQPAAFEIGLLSNSDWKAKWIAMPGGDAADLDLSAAQWIWHPDQNEKGESPKGARIFRKEFDLAAGARIEEALLVAAADNSAQTFVNGKEVGTAHNWTSVKAVDVKAQLKSGRNVIAVVGGNDGGPAGLALVVRMKLAGGKTQFVATDGTWKSAEDTNEDWKNMPEAPAGFGPAKVVAKMGEGPWGKPRFSLPSGPSSYLRKEFSAKRQVKAARLYVSALGLYEAYLDGKKLGNAYFTPGWTDYSKRIQYQVYNVTSALGKGEHALGLVLGDGWYCGNVCWFGRNLYGPKPRGLAQLEIEYDDASRETIASDGTWRVSTGPITMNDTLMGENHDARLAMPGWASPAFSDRNWTAAEATDIGGVPLVPQNEALVEKVAELKPIAKWQDPKGNWVFDLGQNMVGWARLKVRGAAGTTVTLKFAEMLNPDRSIYTTNLRSAKQTDTYILRGGAAEVWEPSFTFHGFRYVEVSGYPGTPGNDAVTGIVLSSANAPSGTFETSSKLVNQIQHNIVWGMMGNYLEVPTDCPQRDERLGWMGDAQVFVRTGCFNFDIAPFMTKWITDVRDAQSAAGAYRDVSPNALGEGNSGSPAWGDAGIIVPWVVYRCYGDTQILERHYDSMKKWIAYIHEENPDLLWIKRSGANYGDWLSIKADTPKDVLATAYFAYSTRLLGKIAAVLGKTEDATRYETLFTQIRDAFNKNYVQPDGRIKGDTQTCYVLALRFDLLPQSLRPKAEQFLVENIAQRKGLLSTGFVGTGLLAPTLSEIGQNGMSYALLLSEEFPSWGYEVKHGATTIWERWDGWTEDKGFQDPGMNSFNHYAFGAIGEWMYNRVAGIELDDTSPGYQKFKIVPTVGVGITWVKSSLDTLHGKIVCNWKTSGGKLTLDLTVPANTTATVVLPTYEADRVTEGGKAAGAKRVGSGLGAAVEVGGGTYRFEAPLPPKTETAKKSG